MQATCRTTPTGPGARAIGGRRAVLASPAVARFAFAVFACVTAAAICSLPWTLAWHDVQPLSVVRQGPSFSPAAEFDLFAAAAPRRLRAMGYLVFLASSWLGHDDLGRSVLFRLLPGFLVSLAVGLAGAAMAGFIGVLWGSAAAIVGGWVDRIMMRIVDVLYALPYILTVVLLKIALSGPLTLLVGHSQAAGIIVLMIAIAGVSWLTMARVVRGQVLSLRTRPYVEAARASGASSVHILRWHLLPNMVGPIIAYMALVVPQAILQEAFLSFLGIGVPPPAPSLGRLAAEGVEAVNTFVGYWWLIVFPCGLLFLALFALNAAADALRDRLDPRGTHSGNAG